MFFHGSRSGSLNKSFFAFSAPMRLNCAGSQTTRSLPHASIA